MSEKRICAIIATYNRAQYLPQCLNSLLRQSRPLDEIIVVNDGSTDDTKEVLSAYSNKITYLEKKNGGKAAALNFALEHTNADYIWICDDDDFASPQGLEYLYEALLSDVTADFSYGKFEGYHICPQTNQYIMGPPSVSKRNEEPNIKINFLENMFTFQFAILAKRSLYLNLGKFNESLLRSQDYEMVLRMSRHSKAVFTDNIIFYQRQYFPVAPKNTKEIYKRLEQWMSYDQQFFYRIVGDYDLFEFTPTFALNWDISLKKRASHIQRGLITAKRGLWDLAVEDFQSALRCCSNPITQEERNLCRQVIQSPMAWLVLARNEDALEALHYLYKQNKNGRILISSIMRPMYWMTKNAFKHFYFSEMFSFTNVLKNTIGLRAFLPVRI